MHSNDYWSAKHVPEGLIAKRTTESGMQACMEDPALVNETSLERYKTSSKAHDLKPLDTVHRSTTKSQAEITNVNMKEYRSSAEQSYGPLAGKKRNTASRLREICGNRAS